MPPGSIFSLNKPTKSHQPKRTTEDKKIFCCPLFFTHFSGNFYAKRHRKVRSKAQHACKVRILLQSALKSATEPKKCDFWGHYFQVFFVFFCFFTKTSRFFLFFAGKNFRLCAFGAPGEDFNARLAKESKGRKEEILTTDWANFGGLGKIGWVLNRQQLIFFPFTTPSESTIIGLGRNRWLIYPNSNAMS